MVSFEEAFNMVMQSSVQMNSETVTLADSLGRVLAQDVCSDMPMPPFNKAAMDGYACRREDLHMPLKEVEQIPAGTLPQKSIQPGECARIMTGATIPEGADCVVMVEYTQINEDASVSFLGKKTPSHIYWQGEDIKEGDTVLPTGTLINSAHIAIMAIAGCHRVLVSKQPQVGIFSTGSELVPPAEKATGAFIRDSNSWQLAAQAQKAGMLPTNYGIASDNMESLDALFKKALSENTVIILSGGVSMGDYDLVPDMLLHNGFTIEFNRISLKPGKPSTFATRGKKRVFALPGNPVSTFIQFEMLVKPFLYHMMGHAYQAPEFRAELDISIEHPQGERTSVLPVRRTERGHVAPVRYNGSAHMNALAEADGYIIIPQSIGKIEQGSIVDVRSF